MASGRIMKYDPKVVQAWVDYLNEGHTYAEAGKHFKASSDAIYTQVKKTGKVARRIEYPKTRIYKIEGDNGASPSGRQLFYLAQMLDKAIAKEISATGKISPMMRMALVLTGEIMK